MPATVLCVQEDREICRLYMEALDAEGFESLPAHDGGQALEILRRQRPDFVVLDVRLPRQDGFEILAEMRTIADADVPPVLMLCEGDATPDVVERAKRLGALGVATAPIAADRLVAHVSKAVKGNASTSTSLQSIPSRGSLIEVPFPELLHELHRAELDGVVLVEHGRKKKAIEFRAGWPVAIKSNLVSECFGSYLVVQGRCTREQFDESVERMRTGEGMQGEILVGMEVLDESDLVDALTEHALEKLLDIFSWRDGRFEVRAGVRVQRGSSIAVEGHPSRLIMQGIARHAPVSRIDRYLEIHADRFVVPGVAPSGGAGLLSLTEEEIDWLEGMHGSLRLSAVAKLDESIRRMVFGLICIEMLQVEETGAGRTKSAEPKRIDVRSAARASEKMTRRGSEADEDLRAELAGLANRMQDQDHYGVLGVDRDADDETIEDAYATLSRVAHADRFHGASSSVRQLASQVAERIAEAHRGIATEEARTGYDQELARGRQSQAAEGEGRRALQAETEFQKGERFVAERDYESALLCFGRAMENFPSEGEYRAHYGWCLYLCHPDSDLMLHEALEHCREGLKLAKDREKPYLLLGRLYKAMGKTGAAKKMFTRAVQIKPQCVEAMRELRIMNMRRDKDKGMLKRLFRR